MLAPGQSRSFALEIEAHTEAAAVQAAESAVTELQGGIVPEMLFAHAALDRRVEMRFWSAATCRRFWPIGVRRGATRPALSASLSDFSAVARRKSGDKSPHSKGYSSAPLARHVRTTGPAAPAARTIAGPTADAPATAARANRAVRPANA